MAIHLNYNEKNIESLLDKNPEIHFMPCSIKADGPANVSTYFKVSVSEENPNYLKASFRGHPLIGEKIKLPAGYKGLVLQETKQPLVENVERNLHVINAFDQFTYWNWDKVPSQNDAFISAMSWIDIAEALHAPIDN